MARGGRRSRRVRAASPSPELTPARAATQQERPSGPWSEGRSPFVHDVSAGGVVFRRSPHGNVEVALVGRLRPRRWALPKGTPQTGETLEETALREVAEETGLRACIVDPLAQVEYWFMWGWVRHFKRVHFYLMEAAGGDIADHDHEYDVVQWFPIAEAVGHLSYANEAGMVEEAIRVLGLLTE